MVELTNDNVKRFALAGNCTITLKSGDTGIHYTYNIKQYNKNKNIYFVHVLRGPDNTEDYTYMACYYIDTDTFVPAKPWKERPWRSWPPSLRAIRFFFMNIDDIPKKLHVYHEGRCGRCGKKLTTPESIINGLGPECMRLLEK